MLEEIYFIKKEVQSMPRMRVKLAMGAGIMAMACILSWGMVAGAQPQPSWTDQVALDVAEVSPPDRRGRCISQNVTVRPVGTQATLCVYDTGYLHYALYKDPGDFWDGQDHYHLVVAYPHDTDMYEVNGVGIGQYANRLPLYLPGSDDFIFFDTVSRFVVKDVSKNLKRVTQVLTGMTLSYNLTAKPLFPDSQPGSVHTLGYLEGVSQNGRWAVFYDIYNNEIVRLDLSDYSVRRIKNDKVVGDANVAYSTYLAVSNDGQFIAAMGDVAFRVYKITNTCGIANASGGNIDWSVRVGNSCPSRMLSGSIIGTHYFELGQFDASDSELTVYAQDVDKWFTLTLPGYVKKRVDYMALGDSYSSGEGENDDVYYQPYTNNPPDTCHQSRRSYPYLLAQNLAINDDDFKSVACSGAVIDDITANALKYSGQTKRLEVTYGHPLTQTELITVSDNALAYFFPGRIPQSDFVKRYEPHIVTLGIGGNDAGFLDKIRSCFGLDECEWAAREKRQELANEIKNEFGRLVETYQKIKTASPGVRLYVIGYPEVIDPNGVCEVPLGQLLNNNEKHLMYEAVHYINQVIAAAAYKTGVKYIDTETSFGDKTLCGSSDIRAMNGIRLGDDSSLVEWLPGFKVIGNESLHPNPLGNALISKAILQAVPDLRTYDVCQGQSPCAHDTVTAPPPPSYWQFDTNKRYTTLLRQNYAAPSHEASQTLDLRFGSMDFMSHSQVGMEAHSEARDLGTFTTDDEGGLTATVHLPADLGPGYHTLHAIGLSPSGEPIDIYQVILVTNDGRVLTLDQEAAEATQVKSDEKSNSLAGGDSGQAGSKEQKISGNNVQAQSAPESNAGTFSLGVINMPTTAIASTGESLATAVKNSPFLAIGMSVLLIIGGVGSFLAWRKGKNR